MKKIFSLFAAVLFAGSMMATPYKWDGRGVTTEAAATEVGGKAAGIYFSAVKNKEADDYNTNTNMKPTDQKGNWCMKIGKGFKYTATERYYFGIHLDEPVNAGDTIKVAAFMASENACEFGMDFNTDSASQATTYQVTIPKVQLLSSNGVPSDTTFIVPEGVSNAKYLRVYRKSGSTTLWVAHLEVAHKVVPPTGWDGTVSLSKTEFRTLKDLEGLTLTFNGATSVASLDEEADIIALQNEDGSELYAVWAPGYNGTYTVNGNTITLYNWYDNTESSPLPLEDGSVYFEDYGAFSVDGEADYFETVEASYIAPVSTTYTVTYSVTGFDAEHCSVKAGYFDENETVSGEFVAGENTIPENVYAYINAVVIDDYTVEVKVNGAAVELIDGQWYSESVITADMTIDVTFTAPVPGPDPDDWATVYTTNVEFTAGTNSYLTDKIIISETEYNAYKIGTSKAGGSCSVTLPAGTESFHFHAICWGKTADTDLKITGAYEETVVIKAANISGNSPYTFDLDYADPTERYYAHEFVAPLTEAATVTFSCGYRAVFFGVNAVVKSTPTAVENVEAVKATKVMVNGQMLIIRDGKTYNVMGMQF